MVDRFYGYQYDTNPRKLNLEHTTYRNRYPKKEEPVSTKSTSKSRNNNSSNTKYRSNTRAPIVTQDKQNKEYIRKQVISSNNIQRNIKNNVKTKKRLKARLKMILFLIAGFSVLFAISYQNSLISESFNKKEQYKKEMEALSKTNQQIEVNIENSLNLNNIEQAAKERIGMQKLNNSQKIYVNLPKQDYIAPATEQIVIDEQMGFFEKLLRGFGIK